MERWLVCNAMLMESHWHTDLQGCCTGPVVEMCYASQKLLQPAGSLAGCDLAHSF